MRYAIIDSETSVVANVIEAELPGAMSLIQGGLKLVQCFDKPVTMGDRCEETSGRFFRTTDGVESEIISPSVQAAGTAYQSTTNDLDEMAVDHEYRLTMLELGV